MSRQSRIINIWRSLISLRKQAAAASKRAAAAAATATTTITNNSNTNDYTNDNLDDDFSNDVYGVIFGKFEQSWFASITHSTFGGKVADEAEWCYFIWDRDFWHG